MLQLNRSYSFEIDSGSEVKTITGLRISFDITKTSVGSWDTATIMLYNMSDSTAHELSNNPKIRLFVGYNGNNKLIYSGTVMNSFISSRGVVEIYSSDGELESKKALVSKTYDKSFGVVDVVKDVVKSMPGVILGDVLGVENIKTDVLGGTYVGEASQVLDEISASIGFDWSISDGVVTVSDASTTNYNDIVVISAATGMISTPVVTHDGVEIDSLMNPLIVPNSKFEVKSEYVSLGMGGLEYERYERTSGNGIYKAIKINHKGDTHDKDWVTSVKGVSIV